MLSFLRLDWHKSVPHNNKVGWHTFVPFTPGGRNRNEAERRVVVSSSAHQIRIRGKQRERIDADLLAQIVLMLGRQLAQEATAAERATSGSPDDAYLKADDLEEDSP